VSVFVLHRDRDGTDCGTNPDGMRSEVTEVPHEGAIIKLFVRAEGVQIKIEVNPFYAGAFMRRKCARSLHGRRILRLCRERIVSFADLFAGKLVAALDRQHPRDLFECASFLPRRNDQNLRHAFIVTF
jgi:hypothetical protein